MTDIALEAGGLPFVVLSKGDDVYKILSKLDEVAPVKGVAQVLESSASSWKKHGARLYADLKNVFKLDVPFAAKSADAAKLVAAEYQKLIQSGVLKYKGFVDDVHGSFHVYEHGGNLYLFGKDGGLISRLAPGSEGRALQRILGLLGGGNP
jgi:hypothetical protein